jgi:hypothetical protein
MLTMDEDGGRNITCCKDKPVRVRFPAKDIDLLVACCLAQTGQPAIEGLRFGKTISRAFLWNLARDM